MPTAQPIPESAQDHEPDSVATPEGDNEIPPDQPLQPAADIATNGLETPRGNNPGDPYKNDRS